MYDKEKDRHHKQNSESNATYIESTSESLANSQAPPPFQLTAESENISKDQNKPVQMYPDFQGEGSDNNHDEWIDILGGEKEKKKKKKK